MKRLLALAAALTATLVACGDGSSSTDPTPCAVSVPVGTQALTLHGTSSLTFEPDQLTAAAGVAHVGLINDSSLPHSLVIDGTDLRLSTPSEGDTCAGVVTLEPGSWEFWCDIPGHREGGMEGVLTVE